MNSLFRYLICFCLLAFGMNVSATDDNKCANESELSKLIDAANYEINGDYVNKLQDGTYKETNRFHLEAYGNSCAYVAVFIKSYIDRTESAEYLKSNQLDVFRYVKPNPEFQKLLDYLIEHNLPLYQYFITKDCKCKTPVAVYNKEDLLQIGIYAE